jgi:hypothetical protein
MNTKMKILVYAIVILFGVSGFALWQGSRTQTSISITSASGGEGASEEKMKVNYRVDGGARDFTIVVLPDTQYYSQLYPEIYASQTQWIVDIKDKLNIVFVSHVGDIVQNDDVDEAEWQAANTAMSMLDDVVPYGILPGNHDMQVGGKAKFYEQYFPASRFDHQSWWGGSFDNNRYNYQLFSAGGDDYVILHMQYCPTGEAIEWANGILAEFPTRKAIVSTHAYLLHDGSHLKNCQDRSSGNVNGAQMWRNLVKKNLNVFMVLSGHIPGVAQREDLEGRVVYQLLADYQNYPMGGNGYLRIMTFEPQNDTIRVTSYSPYLDQYLTDSDNQFDLFFDMTGDTQLGGNVIVYSGSSYCIGSVAGGSCEIDVVDANSLKAVYLGDLRHKASKSSALSNPSP